MNNIGEEIKKLRTARGMTQLDLAKRLNITKSTVSAYENGIRLPSYDVLLKIAHIFHVTTDNILGLSQTYVIDVTDLTLEQRTVIQSIVCTYRSHNELLARMNNT